MKPDRIIHEFKRQDLGPYIEVPCSLLGPLIEGLTRDKACEVINPANEAVAMGIASGSYLVTGRVPVVMTQNSGLCNTLNALTSLNQLYKIPVLYLISWRGEPGIKDAPEHTIMGGKLELILATFDIPYKVLKEKTHKEEIRAIVRTIRARKTPGALLITRGLLDKEGVRKRETPRKTKLSLANAVGTIMESARGKACYVTTNGFISREAKYVLSSRNMEKANPSFYMLGSMGHALPIAIGMAKNIRNGKRVIVLDGDGGCLMHMGAMAQVGNRLRVVKNLIHVVLDNGVYASTGSQPCISRYVDFKKIASGCGYINVKDVRNARALRKAIKEFLSRKGSSFIHVEVNDIKDRTKPRVSEMSSCEEIKKAFISLVS